MQEGLDDQVYDNSDLPPNIKHRLRNYRRMQEDLVDTSQAISNHNKQVERLERLMTSENPAVRNKAQRELITLNRQIDDDIIRFQENPERNPNPIEVEDEAFSEHTSQRAGSIHSNSSDESKRPTNVIDLGQTNVQPMVNTGPVAGPSHTIRIRAPNIEIDIGPTEQNTPVAGGSKSVTSSRERDKVVEWLDEHCTVLPSIPSSIKSKRSKSSKTALDSSSNVTEKDKTTGDQLESVSLPTITRSGRHSIPPTRYGDFTPVKYSKSKDSSTKNSDKSTKSSKKTDKKSSEKETQLSDINEETESKDPNDPKDPEEET